jgi:succinyl-CoA synthetase alpha subunit
MSVLINKDTKVICQGFTGSQVHSTLNKPLLTVRKWLAA